MGGKQDGAKGGAKGGASTALVKPQKTSGAIVKPKPKPKPPGRPKHLEDASKLTGAQLKTYLSAANESQVGSTDLLRSRIVTLIKKNKFSVGELKAMSQEMGGAGTGDGDALKRKLLTAFKEQGYK